MKSLRLYGALGLGYCLWRLLFPPWIESEYGQIWYPDTLRYRLGHHWRFSAPMHWSWSFDTRTSIYVADWGARIDYRLMLYEIILGLVAIGFLVFLVDVLQSPVRALIIRITRHRRIWLDRRERSWSRTHLDGN
jgi:hypothetical protein